jgi:hypothetical protein
MCALTVFLLWFPGTVLDALWTLNPEARRGFQSLGKLSILLMVVVGSSCALTGIGLVRNTRWAVQINSERTHGIGEKGDLATVPGKYSVASARKTGVNSGLVQLIAGEENER